MPANVQNARFFKLTTDFPLDKVVFLDSGSFTVPDGTLSDFVNIAHLLPFCPLPILLWSTDENFSTTYMFGDPQYYANEVDGGFNILGQFYSVTADTTDITINQYNNSGSDQTIYWRVFCFAPSTAPDSAIVPFTASKGDSFVLNTDYNYFKLYKKGKLDYATPPADVAYDHDLGYIPRVWAWGCNVANGAVTFASYNVLSADILSPPASSFGVDVTTTQLIWHNPSDYDAIEYRLYLDD